jgi:hypothetical protein
VTHLEAGFDFDAYVGTTNRALDRLSNQVGRLVQQPSSVHFEKVGNVDANGDDMVIALRGPEQGFEWYVMQVAVGGLTWATTAAGKALLVVTAMELPSTGASSVAGLASIRDEADSLPLPAFYSRGQIPLKWPEKLSIIITGGTANQQYVASVTVEEFQSGERQQVSAV